MDVTPFPHCPYVFHPQQYTPPAALRAHVCESPALTAIAELNTGPPGGLDTLPVPLLPSWPYEPMPQQYTPPTVDRAHV